MKDKNISRRSFLKYLGLGSAAAVAACAGRQGSSETESPTEPPVGQMTYRKNPKNGDQVSLLGYGMMRLPTLPDSDEFDQEMINSQVDYALEHGLNYFDTSPAYCRGQSEHCTGIALSRHPREKYFVATKLSNFNEETWSREASIEMYHNSMRELQVDYIDYYLLHGIGMGGMESLQGRYLDNGILDYLLAEREAGRIKNLGFSYHGDIAVFDHLLALNDKYHWDFVQIELNYLDWNYADDINPRNTDASYLYDELLKRGIPAVIMEPLLGGRLAKVPQYVVSELKQRDPQRSVASWAFRYAGTPEGVLTVLSGMTYMEHLKDNLLSYCPLVPLTEEEQRFLDTELAHQMMEEDTIPCNDCKYCMPCPYGIDIPAAFVHYNKMKIEGQMPDDAGDANYRENRRRYLISLDRAIPRDRQPDHCIMCGQCEPHCPQKIRIPQELKRIADLVEQLKSEK
ncbi:MAG: aldo/keto reductase [Prevotella sp.]|nr:aldo/keto reductase [Prevotella sp.]MBR1449902.1 aldo/keto reductase [Prevotella sp.]